MVEIVEASADEASPLLTNSNPNPTNRTRSVRTKVPEVEVHLYRRGKGPVDVFKSCLGGWDQDQLDVREILDKYGFKSVYAFKPESGRGVPIRFNPRNGRSILTYHDGSKIYVDGEPKDALIKPITRILVGVAVVTILIVLLVIRDPPEWAKKLNLSDGRIPPWLLACVFVVFTRMRKRTRDFLENRRK
uniref:Uncharacterized protein n=2 Tax=Nicotiana TaxID=4085 RepID=A0A1S4DBE5_TOBAC|nr:PREDICTED: uncharacterized protein LOC104227401 [Nicotiana sylvestris]XP_016510755.1 PREDICTED: uncharacterized protein LOC107828017 [Nicotiana tabacum]